MGAPYRLPLATARAIDRLAWRAHAFHRYAHHPLCERYRGEVLSVGRTRLCRGCTAVCLGSALGACLGAFAALRLDVALGLLAVSALLGVSSLWVRLSKRLGRFFPAFGLAFALIAALRQHETRVALVAGTIATLGFAAYRRRRPHRAPCVTCPELRAAPPCSGFAPIVRRERAFRRAADRLIATAELAGPARR